MTFSPEALDRHITGNWGEDQFSGIEEKCGEPLRDGPCTLDPGHRGRHTTVSFFCDLCGKRRRGSAPYTVITQLMSDGYREPMADVCFMCAEIERR